MKRLLGPLVLWFLVAGVACAANIPEQVKKAIGFIFVPGPTAQPVPNGTCFFVFVKDEAHPDRGWGYLVTAKHVVQQEGVFYPNVWVRLNKKAGGVESLVLPLVLNGPQKNVFVHEDSSVDLVVVRVPQPDPTKYDVFALPQELLTSQHDFDELKISEGSDVFFTGMFLPHIGANKNYPVVRFGRVALLSDERINWDSVAMDLYLIETLSFGGNSGAPVFFYLGGDRTPGVIEFGPPILKLAGIMKGFFGELEPIGVVETRPTPASRANVGIAAVIPAYKLHDILNGSELQDQRKGPVKAQ